MIAIKSKNDRRKIRVNITVDKDKLERAKTKLRLFGGKVSTLFNSYLNDFVDSIDAKYESKKSMEARVLDLEKRLKDMEKKRKK